MRFSGAKVHQVYSLGPQFGGLGGHSHGLGDFDPANPVGKDFCRSQDGHNASYLDRFWAQRKTQDAIGQPIQRPDPIQALESRVDDSRDLTSNSQWNVATGAIRCDHGLDSRRTARSNHVDFSSGFALLTTAAL
jgi:hypothetical protein